MLASGRRYLQWRDDLPAPRRVEVAPDGCRDVVVVESAGGGFVTLTQWDAGLRVVELAKGTRVTGYRLRPGAQVAPGVLARIEAEPLRAGEIIDGDVVVDRELDEAIGALGSRGVAGAATHLGVSRRGLQRRFAAAGLPPPGFWRLLSRARRAALALPMRLPLSEVAVACGFSDQAHLTRETVRWFGRTPAELRRSPSVLGVIAQPGLGNWIGEQISTR
ncbi:AraC family transcriptional regulator [Jiangella alba]|uniref:Helix-turn-helix domain-containing protein n=1 Tax=Jiangella alba TaxID=561176 RepID=A0A1H5HHU0_9ACTN|nr:helix-turn-helix domain-containing protein [Jiangella alba]SEE27440.1 Helix-turn-helix domain-containing protein [Jiangella alba]